MKNTKGISPSGLELGNLKASKTKLKQHMQQLQDLGIKLISLNSSQLKQFNLPAKVLEAITLAQTINSHGAFRRQCQYIGKLMREVDYDYIQSKLLETSKQSAAQSKLLHLCEQWRLRLLSKDEELQQFLHQYPQANMANIQALIKMVRQELKTGQTRNYRKLFKFIRDIVGGNI